jgi:hypothetical protein
LNNAHFRPDAHRRRDVELVNQPARSAESQSHAFCGAETISKCPFDIRNPRAGVFENQLDANAPGAFDFGNRKRAASAVNQRIARQFTGGRDELGSVQRAERQPCSPILNRLTGQVDLIGRANVQNGFA